ncbi:hypothetical protein KPATCC21470_7600 [Kitasatospora purpeofusca]
MNARFPPWKEPGPRHRMVRDVAAPARDHPRRAASIRAVAEPGRGQPSHREAQADATGPLGDVC